MLPAPTGSRAQAGKSAAGSEARLSHGLRRRLGSGVLLLGIVVLLIMVVYPLLWLFLSSLKTSNEFNLRPLYSLPEGMDWQNYIDAFTTGNLGTYFMNSVLTVFPSLFLILVLALAAGFGLEVMIWRGRNVVALVFLAGIMVPLQMVLLPLFTIYFHLNLIDTRWALIITYTGFSLPLSVFLMAGFYKSVPREVIEAATMDGAGIYTIFYRIGVPLVANGLATIGLVQFFFLWNDLLFSLTFISSDSLRTIQTGLFAFAGQYGAVSWGPTFAAISLAVFPTLVLYLVLNQKVMAGLAAGSIKG